MNGGGQIREEGTNTLSKELLEKVELAYNSVKKQIPGQNALVKSMYEEEWLKSEPASIHKHLHTAYHEVEKITNGLAIRW